ncbi:magnesium transporter [Parapedobacter pyrenivorans]|uniref:Magnesium transporter n=1 Tax=Parapedobacter pyrenivorans TaxID=1305674 RepID=A0A917I1R7_9SPHI|nr:MgtC/SapB family protein [Parapedobacter pyrenivorans]GGH01992.1 magnesium transporter [Parapedobacter pyrenivorans]
MEEINQHFQQSDILKAVSALVAGILLGYERESKDKSAGLKTITIITVGSALFAILSQNYSGKGDSFSIAAGIISGIGFLGAGVIFKEGFTIYGLTTAGIIWVSAAIGMAIGFGEFYIAGLFLFVTMAIVFLTQTVGKQLIPANSTKALKIKINKEHAEKRFEIIDQIRKFTIYQSVVKTEKNADSDLTIDIDIHIRQKDVRKLEQYLYHNGNILSYSV